MSYDEEQGGSLDQDWLEDKIDARREADAPPPAAKGPESCQWIQDGQGEDAWDTACRRRFRLDEGAPSDNNMTFCCFCGKPIQEVLNA